MNRRDVEMAKTTVYVVNGTEEVTSLKALASVLGVAKITGKDIEAGNYPNVEVRVDDDASYEEGAVTVVTEPVDEPTGEQEAMDEDTEEDDTQALTNEEDTEDEDEPSKPVAPPTPVDEDIEYPERGYFKDVKAMKKYVKKLKDSQLQEWCELEGATWTANDHESINRMRMAMAIKAIHFPDTAPKAGSKSKSKYADYTLEQLVQMAMDNDVEVRDDKGNERILRMYTIMALKEAGLLA